MSSLYYFEWGVFFPDLLFKSSKILNFICNLNNVFLFHTYIWGPIIIYRLPSKPQYLEKKFSEEILYLWNGLFPKYKGVKWDRQNYLYLEHSWTGNKQNISLSLHTLGSAAVLPALRRPCAPISGKIQDWNRSRGHLKGGRLYKEHLM